MKLITETYLEQKESWPITGRHILAQSDDNSIIVYQAYSSSIGLFAAKNQFFGGDFNLNRMSWIKPNFLWMMYRSGWGTKVGQEVTLAVRIKREAFDYILSEAVHSTFVPEIYGNNATWQEQIAKSSVRLQWDPDHDPSGTKLERRAVQLGLRGETLAQYAKGWIIEIEDISNFVQEQRIETKSLHYSKLITPAEKVYSVPNTAIARNLGLSK